MGKYFSNLPIVTYNNRTARNILARGIILDIHRKDSTVFYPYTIKEGERMDVLSYKYYSDSFYDWLIYLTTNI